MNLAIFETEPATLVARTRRRILRAWATELFNGC